MAQIPIGNFGDGSPGVASIPDVGAVGRGLEQVGSTVSAIGAQRIDEAQGLARLKAHSAAQDDQLAVGAIQQDLTDQIATGKLAYEDARDQFDEQVRKLRPPQLNNLDAITSENLDHAVQLQRQQAGQEFGQVIAHARHQDGEVQYGRNANQIASLSQLPDANFPKLLTRLTNTAQLARATGVQPSTIEAVQNQARTAIGRSAAKLDPQGALAKLQQEKTGDPAFDSLDFQGRNDVIDFAKSQLVEQTVQTLVGTFEHEGPQAGAKALSLLDHSNVPPELRDDVRAHVNQQVAQMRTQQLERYAPGLAKLESAITTGVAGSAEHKAVDDLYTAGALTPTQYAGYHSQIDASIMRRAQDDAGAREISQALAQGLPLDIKNHDQRVALDAAFRKDTAATPIGSPQWSANALAYVSKTRMIPDSALAWTRQALRSPSPLLASTAAQFFGAVNTAAPDAAAQFDDQTRPFAAMLNGMLEAGAPMEKAFETARANVLEIKPEIIERRKLEYVPYAKQSDNALKSFIGRDFGEGFFSRDPAATATMKTDFDSQSARYFTKTGDIELARSLAWEDLSRVYGVSHVNGVAQAMAFPPERFGLQPAQIRNEIGEFLKTHPQADGSMVEDIALVPDGLTLRDVGDALRGVAVAPSYKLITKSGDVLLDEHGTPKRFSVPTGEALGARIKAAQAAASLQAHDNIVKAKAARAAAAEAGNRAAVRRARSQNAGLR